MTRIHQYILFVLTFFCVASGYAQKPGVMPDSLPAKAIADGSSAIGREQGDAGISYVGREQSGDENFSDNGGDSWEKTLQQKLDKMMKHSLLESTQLGLMVWDLDADSCIYKHGERQRLRPASTMKVITAVAALDYLGGDYRFTTELRSKGDIILNADSTRTYKGMFYCVGGFDPKFSTGDMGTFATAIGGLGVDSIIGSICGDMSFKDDKLLGEGWCWDDDNPELSPLLVGRKNAFAETLRKQLLGGKTVVWLSAAEGTAAEGSTLMGRVEHTIDDVLGPMMKNSDNLYAEALFYQIAHRRKGRNASAADARQQIYDTMRKAGLNTSQYYIADGSGLSLYTYVTPQAETMMLRYAYSKPEIYDHLLPSLPVAGVDGTLASRMKGGATRGNVRAKTGTVTGVSSLAGYCRGGNGHQLCFSIINQGVKASADGRKFQDAVCTMLCQ